MRLNKMEVILTKDVEKLGKAGEVLKVKPGFARNYLIPKGIAVVSSEKNLKLVEYQKKLRLERQEREKKEAQGLVERISQLSCTILASAGEDEKLFGAVTSADIADALFAEGIKIDKRRIVLEEPIKKLGIYSVAVRPHPEVTANLRVWVVKK